MTHAQRLGLIGTLGAAGLLWPLFTPKIDHFYGVLSATYALVALSLVILVGWTGQVSLCHAAFLGFGCYVGQKLLAHGVPVLVAILVVAAFGAVISLALGVPSLRLKGVYLTIATLAFGAACQRYFFQLSFIRSYRASVVPRPPIFGLSMASDRALYYLVIATFAVALLVAYNLRRTDFGRTLFAIRDSEAAAQAMAVSIAPYKIAAFALSAAFATVAGLFYGMLYQATPGADQFGVLQSFFYLAMPVLGGIEVLVGAVFGGAFLATAQPVVNLFHIRLFLASSGALILMLLSGYDGVAGMLTRFARTVREALAGSHEQATRYGSFLPEDSAVDSRPPRLTISVGRPLPDGTLVSARVVGRSP
ncbi:MAG: branched-chain amino acid ABC transporter permease [Acidimicrobiales bacterium]